MACVSQTLVAEQITLVCKVAKASFAEHVSNETVDEAHTKQQTYGQCTPAVCKNFPGLKNECQKYRLESLCLDTLHSDFSKKYTHERVKLAGLQHSRAHDSCVDLQQVSICNGWGGASTHGIPGHVWHIEEADC